jgi:hypothetical protein
VTLVKTWSFGRPEKPARSLPSAAPRRKGPTSVSECDEGATPPVLALMKTTRTAKAQSAQEATMIRRSLPCIKYSLQNLKLQVERSAPSRQRAEREGLLDFERSILFRVAELAFPLRMETPQRRRPVVLPDSQTQTASEWKTACGRGLLRSWPGRVNSLFGLGNCK